MSCKISGAVAVLGILRKTIGVGALAPIRAVFKDVWIADRIFFDFAMDTDISLGIWFWAFRIPLLWPMYAGTNYYSCDPLDPPRVTAASHDLSRQPTGQASSRSASGSSSQTAASSSSNHSQRQKESRASPRIDDYLLLRDKISHPMSHIVRGGKYMMASCAPYRRVPPWSRKTKPSRSERTDGTMRRTRNSV